MQRELGRILTSLLPEHSGPNFIIYLQTQSKYIHYDDTKNIL